MVIELRKLSVDDGMDIYNLLQQVPQDENGFINNCNGRSFDEYKAWLSKCEQMSHGEVAETWQVPQTNYWLMVDGVPVGIGKLRDRLTEHLREVGGHGGYAIVPAQRGKGYGTMLLKLLIDEARRKGIDQLLLTVQNHNVPSIKVALHNGGVIERVSEDRHYIVIDCNPI